MGIDRRRLDVTQPLYDWPSGRQRYVEGYLDGERQVWPTLNDIAEYLGASRARTGEVCAEEGWAEQRRAWQHRVETERQDRRAKQLAQEGDELDLTAVGAAKLGVGLVRIRLGEILKDQQVNPGRIRATELSALGQAADLFHRIGLRALGDPGTQRLEITGANGRPIDIAATLRRDDPERLVGVLAVLRAAGLEGVIDLESEEVDDDGEGLGGREALEPGG